MGITILFFAGMSVVAVWWLSAQGITAKPWLEAGPAGEHSGTGLSSAPLAMIGLGVLLAAIGSLFALFISAYLMRMQLADWRPLPKPTLLWVNTGVLMLSSAVLQWVRTAADRGNMRGVRAGLLAAGVLALVFVGGQLLAWRVLGEAGYLLAGNPANSFFYLITALHGVHVLGGLAGLGRSVVRSWRKAEPAALRVGLDLCSLYWDFLLLMWLVLFGLLLLS